ncbi:efflux RND transporter periplasmic adaptor subunit [Clostridium intestinale]|uniref:RND family efflux transporter MFP subunit n=1 Tax=Clostridium intestinale URNW TaxID=1294142 RepID=U2N1C0_9CLOT|nr:biotin/lipoyl-binding protein [Clostridium intestinale]ERK29312.1 RND family efflux transporter MFP subunit [Clostridium intestinale URNW]
MKKKVIAIIIAVVVIGGVFGLNRINKARNQGSAVKTSEVTQGDLQVYLSSTALVKSQEVKDYYGAQAKVTKVNVKVGDTVKKGDVLVTYDQQDLNTQVKQAEIQYNNALLQKQDLVNQNNDIKNKIAEYDKNIKEINAKIEKIKDDPFEIDSLQVLNQDKANQEQKKAALAPISDTKLQQADNSINSAKLTLDNANSNLSKGVSSITADIDGVVTALNVAEGAMGTIQQAAVTVQNVANLKVTLSLSRYDAAKVTIGQDAVIKNNGKEYKGKVSYISPTAEVAKTSTSGEANLSVDINITDVNPELKIGFEADVDILLNEAKNVIKVPTESLKTDKTGKSVIYIVEDNKAVEKEVTKGIQSDTEVQVEGVTTGAKVILNPTDTIKDGTLVK